MSATHLKSIDSHEYGFAFGAEIVGVEVVRQWTNGTGRTAMPYVRLNVVSSQRMNLCGGFFIECPLDDFKAVAWRYDSESGERLTFIPDAPPSNGMIVDVEAT